MNFRGPEVNLAAKFSFIISLPILLASLSLSSILIKHDLVQIELTMRERGKSLTRSVAFSSDHGLLAQDKEILDKIIKRYATEEHLLYLIIRDSSGEILANYGQAMENIPVDTIKNTWSTDEQVKGSKCRVIETDRLYDFSCNVTGIEESGNTLNNVGKLGMVQIGLSKAGMIKHMRESKVDAILLTIGAVTLTILVMVLLARVMVAPVKRLAIAAEEISLGNFDHPVEVRSRDEIGHLAGSFNKMMMELKTSRESLEHQLEVEKNIADELQKKTAELSRSNEELDTFVYTVSHDLKAPLVSLQGFSALLITDCGHLMDDNGRMYIERIQKNTENMGDLIEDLLKLSRIGRLEGQEEPVDISAVIMDVADELALQMKERGTKLIIKSDMPTIVCDRVRMVQIFANLISNADKYMGSDNEAPIIEVGCDEQDDHYKFYVKDNGIGIAEEHHEKIFQILHRLNDVEAAGAGMGLTIVRKIVETFGGKIWVDSVKGNGTTMWFTVSKTTGINV